MSYKKIEKITIKVNHELRQFCKTTKKKNGKYVYYSRSGKLCNFVS